MSKSTPVFVCSQCGENYLKWQGQCDHCKEWNQIEQVYGLGGASKASKAKNPTRSAFKGIASTAALKLSDIKPEDLKRVPTGDKELDRVLGGGLVAGELILLGGQPGAGKSTMLLELASKLGHKDKVLYVSGEESLNQIAVRAQRMGLKEKEILLMNATDMDEIAQAIESLSPHMVIVDSIQVMEAPEVQAAAGSVSQVRACASHLMHLAKSKGLIVWMVGHVTKEGQLAGPKVLEHAVDCSLLLEGMDDERFRVLRAKKNRFGAVGESAVFQMSASGLHSVANPSAIFLAGYQSRVGSLIFPHWEGSRAMLLELQSLVGPAQAPSPRRSAVGLDSARLSMLMAVLSRFGGLSLEHQEVFCNVVGGVKLTETAADLPFLISLISSQAMAPIPEHYTAFGEVGLGGEIRPVFQGEARLREAARQGLRTALVPRKNVPKEPIEGLKVIPVSSVEMLLKALPWNH